MECTLMHKNIPVIDMTVAEDNGYIDKLGKPHNPEHLPVGTAGLSNADKDKPNRAYLNDWWVGRSIPASRERIESALSLKCYG